MILRNFIHDTFVKIMAKVWHKNNLNFTATSYTPYFFVKYVLLAFANCKIQFRLTFRDACYPHGNILYFTTNISRLAHLYFITLLLVALHNYILWSILDITRRNFKRTVCLLRDRKRGWDIWNLEEIIHFA